jgi:threonine/homoserine/homoserine lactone efflux protein
MTPEFMLTTLIVVASPGAGALFTIAAGIARGWRASLVAAFACTLGIVPHVIAAVTGLAAIMHASALAFSIVKWFGVVYLLYLAWKTFRDQSMFDVQTGTTQTSTLRVIGSGVLVNTLNPKLTIFFFAFLPQFVAPGSADAVASMIWLSAIFMAVTLVSSASTACSPRRCGDRSSHGLEWFPGSAAASARPTSSSPDGSPCSHADLGFLGGFGRTRGASFQCRATDFQPLPVLWNRHSRTRRSSERTPVTGVTPACFRSQTCRPNRRHG